MARKTTTEAESEFLFALWDGVVVRILEKEETNRGFLSYVIKSELDILLRTYKRLEEGPNGSAR